MSRDEQTIGFEEGGEAKASGVEDGNFAGPGKTEAKPGAPENAPGKLNPSAPGETGTTPGTNGK